MRSASRRRTCLAAPEEFVGSLLAILERGAEFVVVGVSGVNFYAKDASDAVVTHDLDVWLRPDPANVAKALVALRDAGFTFHAGGEPFVDLEDELVLANVIRHGGTIVAQRLPEIDRLDLMLSLFDFSFAEEWKKAATFEIRGVRVRVGDIDTLLRSKEIAGRPKDVEFLRMHEARFRRLAEAPSRKPKPKVKAVRKKSKPRKRR